jgi:hypothetical protein
MLAPDNACGDVADGHPNNTLRIPYEWVQQQPTESAETECKKDTNNPHYQAVCVLWLSRPLDAKGQLCFIAGMIDRLKQSLMEKVPQCEFAVAGQIVSSQLDAMLNEKDVEFAAPVTLYVTNSTAPNVRIIPRNNSTKLTIEYIIDDDQRLAKALVDELQLRWIHAREADAGDSVAIIAEWDTEYGREMLRVFKKVVDPCIPEYSYLRGLDGKILGSTREDERSKNVEDGSEQSSPAKSSADKPTAKQGEGEPQIDYLRRLARRMKEEHPQLKAIGIVGNDVYDKLLLLKAIRPVFSDAVFFTTDLDARLIQPGNYPDTRNLLIASHYGLTLNKTLQQRVAPFRSSYDTASYLGCLRALNYQPLQTHEPPAKCDIVHIEPLYDPKSGCLITKSGLLAPHGKRKMPIHLYEVARSGPYELSLRDDDQVGMPNPRQTPWIVTDLHFSKRPIPRYWLLLGVAVVGWLLLYPVSRPWREFWTWATTPARALARWLLLGVAVVAMPLVYLVLWPRQGLWTWATTQAIALAARLRPPMAPCPGAEVDKKARAEALRRHRYYLGALLAAVLGAILAVCIYYAHTREGGEPFELFEGLSVWPTVILCLLACGLCVYYAAAAWEDLVERNDGIRDKFSLVPPKDKSSGGRLRDAWAAFRLGYPAWAPKRQESAEVSKLYEQFAPWGSLGGRAWRTLLLTLVYLALFVLLWMLFNPTLLQARGNIAQCCYFVVGWATLLTQAGLLMFVVDCTLLSYRFVTYLVRQEGRKWPTALLKEMAGRWDLPLPINDGAIKDPETLRNGKAVDQWLLIRLIDDVTNVVARLIYYPFVVLLVLIVAQNRLFDNWHWNAPLAIMALFNVVAAVICGVMLQHAAKSTKGKAPETLDRLLREQAWAADDSVHEKVAQIRADIEGTDSGAFASLSQNPIVGAILLPLFGGGGLAALEALLAYLH